MKLEKPFLEDLIRLIKYKYPEKEELIEQLKTRHGKWTYPGLFSFDDIPKDALNMESLDLFTTEIPNLNSDSDIIITILNDGRIRSIKYLSLIPGRSPFGKRSRG